MLIELGFIGRDIFVTKEENQHDFDWLQVARTEAGEILLWIGTLHIIVSRMIPSETGDTQN